MKETFISNGSSYEIRRHPRRKHPGVCANSAGEVWVALPQNCTVTQELAKELSELIVKIIERAKRFPKENLPKPKKYCDGEMFYFKGTEYPLHIRHGNGLNFDGKAFWLGSEDLENAPVVFENWYMQALYQILVLDIHAFAALTGTSPVKVSIHTVKTKWGSCSKSGNIIFNTKLALLPRNLYEYVVIHELCHLKEFNHSKKFWQEVAKYIPDYKERLAVLQKDGELYRWQ